MSEQTHILVVDDEPQIRALLRARLEKDGFRVTEASNAAGVRHSLAYGGVDLITLDLTLGREDGLALARDIRAEHNVPIIMISGKDEEVDRVVGLEVGADDYVTKPFSPREVVARIRAVLRRYEGAPAGASPTPDGRLSFAAGTLDPARREFRDAMGAQVELTTAEFNMLEMFMCRPQRVLSRDEIMTLLKGHDWSPFDRSIDALVVRVRRKIEPDPEQPAYIKTVRGIGYVFAGSVKRG
jgi:DNA-binding response OmpR family regulator